MTEVAGASVIGLATGTACLSIIKYTHARIKETTDLWFIALIRVLCCDFYDGTSLNLFGAKDSKLDSHDRFNIRVRSIETSGHLLFYLCYFSKPPWRINFSGLKL